MTRIIVCGGRAYRDERRVRVVLDAAVKRLGLSFMITGGAMGADWLAQEWAKARGIPNEIMKAEWGKHGKAAGHIRNARMLAEGKPDLVIAFPGERGTANMVKQAEAAGVTVHRIDWSADDPDPFPDEPDPTGQFELTL